MGPAADHCGVPAEGRSRAQASGRQRPRRRTPCVVLRARSGPLLPTRRPLRRRARSQRGRSAGPDDLDQLRRPRRRVRPRRGARGRRRRHLRPAPRHPARGLVLLPSQRDARRGRCRGPQPAAPGRAGHRARRRRLRRHVAQPLRRRRGNVVGPFQHVVGDQPKRRRRCRRRYPHGAQEVVPRRLLRADPSPLRQGGGNGRRFEGPPLQECSLRFSSESVKRLRAKANAETMACVGTTTISSLQAVAAHIWRAVCRARGLAPGQETTCSLSVGCRTLVKGMPQGYVGNASAGAVGRADADEILGEGRLGRAAWLLNRAVAAVDEASVRTELAAWPANHSFKYLGDRPCGDGGQRLAGARRVWQRLRVGPAGGRPERRREQGGRVGLGVRGQR
uniref:Uncharacterized protein n=1 Tax=Aegilops tauschii subsp. strangulata TaxID=200361 RepID=A0A453AB14_AEGTS